MSTEKRRYLNRGPSAPLNYTELKTHIHGFEHEHIVELLLKSAQNNVALWKALMASVSMRLAKGNWDKTKEAIDYAFYFPDIVPYTDSKYSIILDEMIKTLELLKNQVNVEFTLRVARYIFERGHAMVMNFEDNSNWTLSLDELEKWIKNNHAI